MLIYQHYAREQTRHFQKPCVTLQVGENNAVVEIPKEELPEFFIKFLTNEGDLVLDPFAGSNVTGEVCESLQRKWIGMELSEDYLRGSMYRFKEPIKGRKLKTAHVEGAVEWKHPDWLF